VSALKATERELREGGSGEMVPGQRVRRVFNDVEPVGEDAMGSMGGERRSNTFAVTALCC
jgi:hypothetical protein